MGHHENLCILRSGLCRFHVTNLTLYGNRMLQILQTPPAIIFMKEFSRPHNNTLMTCALAGLNNMTGLRKPTDEFTRN